MKTNLLVVLKYYTTLHQNGPTRNRVSAIFLHLANSCSLSQQRYFLLLT